VVLCVIAVLAATLAGCGAATTSPSSARLSLTAARYNTAAARREASHLLTLIRLPVGARRSVSEPAGAGAALASYSVNIPVVPELIDLHEYFVVPSATAASVIDWITQNPPAGSARGDSGSGQVSGEQWTSFDFQHLSGFVNWPDLVANAVPIPNGEVALRVDAQVAPRPSLPGSGRGPGEVRIAELGTMLGSFGYSLGCDPATGTLPDPARVCAAILADPALLYSFPGPDHSCPAGGPTITLQGRWAGKPLSSTFSVCTGGQEQIAGRWATLLPSQGTLATITLDRGIGLIRLDEREGLVLDLLRADQPAPTPCAACTRTFLAGFSIGYGPSSPEPAAWTVTFSHSLVSQITSDFGLTVDGDYVARGFTSLRRALHGWTVLSCGAQRELVHRSPSGMTVLVYGRSEYSFTRAIVSRAPVACSVA
jgi:hypothetical protein